LAGHEDAVYHAQIADNNKTAMTASGDETVRLWELEPAREVIRLRHTSPVLTALLHTEVHRVVSFPTGGQPTLFNVDVDPIHRLRANGLARPFRLEGGEVYSLRFAPRGEILVVVQRDGICELYNVKDLNVLDRIVLPASSEAATENSEKRPPLAEVSKCGHFVAVSNERDCFHFYQVDRGRIIRKENVPFFGLVDLKFVPDSNYVAALTTGGDLSFLDLLSSGISIVNFDPVKGPVKMVRFSNDGKVLATTHSPKSQQIGNHSVVALWDVLNGPRLRHREDCKLDVHGSSYEIGELKFDDTGSRLLVVAAQIATVVDVATAQIIGVAEDCSRHSDFFPSRVGTADFLPGSSKVFTNCTIGGATVWDARTNERSAALPGSRLHPGGNCVVGTNGKMLFVWDTLSGKQIGEISGLRDDITATTFSPDGQWMAIGCRDGVVALVRFFDDVESLVNHGKATVTRGLSVQQRDQFYLPQEPPTWSVKLGKWPFGTLEWKTWLADKETGKNPPLPSNWR
jgi:WD40 repeat protein